ncbi:unnamed protein product [Didymodactylos carnosus]|uniref:UBC core domain-containing protein n=1 Tax=Didymodactylos carnosus TaxID=1234261 RepID=A0A814WEX0_9BILA|nr:unnamed protein product [Didymodactylos carnosus]CAF1200392.1 unnamed protein product [Didymodactylos carnosus]CAF3841871.1 unnamed protein product [Didymodactylos carnosus]CAF3964878.1 unnamed protein product [Didymodactylos carnosus]
MLSNQVVELKNKMDPGSPFIKSSRRSVSNKQTPSDCFVPLQPKEDPPRLKIIDQPHGQRLPSVNNYDIFTTPRSDTNQLHYNPTLRQSNENRSTKVYSSPKTHPSKSCKDEEHAYDSDGLSSSEDNEVSDDDVLLTYGKIFLKGKGNPKPVPNLTQSMHSDFENNSSLTALEEPVKSSQTTTIKARHETVDSSTSLDNIKSLVVHIRTLFQRHCVKISKNTTMEDLINIIWCELQFDMERYAKDSHILLLFNHRLHIFVESDSNALVKDFLSLSPLSRSPTREATDFYVYGLPLQRASSMYKFDNDYISLFGNPDSWCPSNLIGYKQSERSQSILLSSLYTLRLYFRPETRELMAKQLAMEAQFFLELRKYLFPPAILALKHAIIGFMFWFEKALLIDALIQLLTRLCDPETVFPAEICDFIPLLICWLLEKCDPTVEKEDCFREVRLINAQKSQWSYFQNPVTTSKTKRQALLLEEFQEVSDYNDLQYHVDIRSLTLYLSRLTKTSLNSVCKCDDYVIYDPMLQDVPVLEPLERWTEIQIKELYKSIARTRDYRSFSIITRGDVTAHVKNQLVLLQKDRTVAILFSPKNVIRSDGRTAQDVDHFFEIFDPLQCTKDTSYLVVASDAFLDEEKQLPDPRLPTYFNDSFNIIKTNANFSLDDNITVPAYQITVILLDRSRSMSDYRIASSDKVRNCSHIDICKVMLGRLSDNILSADVVHAFGLIEFATKYKTVCPITRSRELFDKALTLDECSGDWTCMYDAIREAIRQIKTFADSPMRARKDCKKLIICLSDGINNSGDTTIQNLHDLTKRNSIVIDLISFVRDDQLKRQEEVAKARQFRTLCTDSGGYIYQNLHVLSDIELASIFEQEAAVWLSKRSKTSHGTIDKPERYIPPNFEESAIRQPSSNKNIQSSSRLRRILNEFQAMLSCSSENVTIFAVSDNIAFWKVILKGPVDTPYQGRFWMLYVEFHAHYPNCPPNVRFVTPIYHVNITGDGKICHQILGRCWCSLTKMSAIFENIFDLLKKPNFDDAISVEKAHLYRENPDDYRRQAEAHSKKYAKNDVKKLKCEYRLEDADGQMDESP